MSNSTVVSLRDAFAQIPDPRDPRGVRHPFAGVVTLMLLGMLGRIREMAVLARWANLHWEQLRDALGFDRDEPPCDTTISRTLARCSLADFQAAFMPWLRAAVTEAQPEWVVAVDGKTCKQGRDDNGDPLHMLHVFLHDVRATLGQWSVGAGKTNEPELLKRRLDDLLGAYPALRLLTGDAIYAQRNLAELLVEGGCDYLFQIKANQQDILDALTVCFADAPGRPPAVETVEKRGVMRRRGGFGSTWTMLIIFAKLSAFPTAASCCASIAS